MIVSGCFPSVKFILYLTAICLWLILGFQKQVNNKELERISQQITRVIKILNLIKPNGLFHPQMGIWDHQGYIILIKSVGFNRLLGFVGFFNVLVL